MFYIRENCSALIVFMGLILVSATTGAMEIKPNASIAMEFTDNARKAANNEIKELIVISSIGSSINEDTGPIKLDANASLKYMDYTQDTFNNQTYLNLNATANWEMLKDRLDWKVRDFFTQQSINSLNPDTPDNIANTNVFTFGPNIYYRISGRQSLTITPEYRRYDYESQNIDNQQNALDANWNYQLYRTVDVGLRGEINKVDYNDQQLTDNTFKKLHFTLSTTRQDYELSGEIGLTRVEREGLDPWQGISGNMRWLYNVTGASSLRAYIATDITDSNNSLLNSALNPDDGDFSNEQISAEILRNNIIRLTYQRNDVTLVSNFWVELRQQKGAYPIGRDVQTAGLEFNYPLNAVVSAGINARYSRIDLTDDYREDTENSVGGNINYRFSRKLLGVVDVKYFNKDSTMDTEEFSEMRALVSLIYGY